MCSIGHRNSRWDVRHRHKGEINAGELLRTDENFDLLFRVYTDVSWFIWFLYGL
jgi:hypothetical protein